MMYVGSYIIYGFVILSDRYIGQKGLIIIGYSRWVCYRIIFCYPIFIMAIFIVGDVIQ